MTPNRLGLVFGLFLAAWHACWSALVATGVGQAVLDFIFWAHFIDPPYHVQPFELARAAILIGVTLILGYVIGFMIGLIWRALHRPAAPPA